MQISRNILRSLQLVFLEKMFSCPLLCEVPLWWEPAFQTRSVVCINTSGCFFFPFLWWLLIFYIHSNNLPFPPTCHERWTILFSDKSHPAVCVEGCVCVHMCIGAHLSESVCAYVCMWKPEDSLGCHFSVVIHHFFFLRRGLTLQP